MIQKTLMLKDKKGKPSEFLLIFLCAAIYLRKKEFLCKTLFSRILRLYKSIGLPLKTFDTSEN